MSVNNSVQYIKAGAVFASGAAAAADKNSLHGPELMKSIIDCHTNMLADGVLLEPISYIWDQSTYTLTIVKIVSSVQDYKNAIAFNVTEAVQLALDAGWTLVE